MGRPRGNSTTDKLQRAVQFGLRTDHFHRAAGPKVRGGLPRFHSVEGSAMGERQLCCRLFCFKELKKIKTKTVVVDLGEKRKAGVEARL